MTAFLAITALFMASESFYSLIATSRAAGQMRIIFALRSVACIGLFAWAIGLLVAPFVGMAFIAGICCGYLLT